MLTWSARKRQFGFILLTIVILLVFSTNGAYGQSAAFATITGRALDPKGASVPNASVTATNSETGIARTTKTTSDGLYRFDNLPPGVYNVAIEASGFSRAEAKSVKLQVGEQRDVNFNVVLAGAVEHVIVTSELPLIEATKTDTSTVIDDKSVSSLPTTTALAVAGTAGVNGISNDYAGLATTVPGVKYDFTGDSTDLIGPGAVNDRGIVVNLDGANISDQVVSTRDALGASLEEVKEFQVLTNNYNAEYGQAGGLVLNVITKSGTNQFHGDAHGYFRGRNLGASDFFYNLGNPADRAPFFKHEGGFTAGGAFVKDRTFWFASLEKAHQGAPVTVRPFNNSVTVDQPTKELLWSAKVDHKVSDKHYLTIRYNIQRDISSNLVVQTGGNTDPTGFVSSVIHDNGLNIGVVSTPTAHTVNEARFAWHRFLTSTPDSSTFPGEKYSNGYVGADFCCPQGGLQNRYQYVDNLSWTYGRHTVKAGTNISHFPYNSLFQQYHFGRYESFAPGTCNPSISPLAPANQCPTQFTIGIGPAFVNTSDTIYGAYLQDSWQIRPNVTLNYGLRYDYEDGAFRGGTIPAPGGGCFQANGIIPACSKDKNNWQPRLGIAWSPRFESGPLHLLFGAPGKSVIRAAGGEFTELAYLNVSLDSLNFDGVNLLTTTIHNTDTGNDGTTKGQILLNSFPNQPSASLIALFKPVTSFFGRVRPIATNLHNPEVRQASLTIERQIHNTFSFSASYQGVFGFGLFGERDRNFPTPIRDTRPGIPAGFFYLPDRPDSRFAAIRTNENSRTSAFHGLILSARQRLAHHIQFQAGYVFSKTLASGEDFFGLSEPGNPLVSPRLDRAVAQNDIRHQGNFGLVVDSEKFINTAGLKHVVNNWTFAIIGTLQSGRPYPVSTGDGAIVGSAFPALGSESNQRPNICTAGSTLLGCAGAPVGTIVTTNIASTSGTNVLLGQNAVTLCQNAGLANCSAIQTTFLAPAAASSSGPIDSKACTDSNGIVGECGTGPATNPFSNGIPVDFQFINGNLARNGGHSLAIYQFDISAVKAFSIPGREGMKLEFKLDAFNVFNHPGFILNNGNDALATIINLPAFKASGGGPNPNFNCASSCINPFTGFYLGANSKPLNISDFRSGRVDKDFNGTLNFNGLGNPSAIITPRKLQLAIRFRW